MTERSTVPGGDERVQLIKDLLSNARRQTTVSNKRWLSVMSFLLIGVALEPTERGFYSAFGATFDANSFFIFVTALIAAGIIAFASAFSVTVKTATLINDLIADVQPSEVLKGNIAEFAERRGADRKLLAEDYLRTGMGSDYVRIIPIFNESPIEGLESVRDALKQFIDFVYVLLPASGLWVLILLKFNNDASEVSGLYILSFMIVCLPLAMISTFLSALVSVRTLKNLRQLLARMNASVRG